MYNYVQSVQKEYPSTHWNIILPYLSLENQVS